MGESARSAVPVIRRVNSQSVAIRRNAGQPRRRENSATLTRAEATATLAPHRLNISHHNFIPSPMTQPILYGIPNCDSVRKARAWLETQQIDYQFVDFKNDPPSTATINSWLASVGAAQLVNRRSTTYRQLEEADKKVLDEGDTASLLATHPTLIKRPVLDWKGQISVGFTAIDYADHFSH